LQHSGSSCFLDTQLLDISPWGGIGRWGTGKLYYFNQYLKGQTLTLEQESKAWRARAAGHLLLDAKLQKLGDKEELPASAWC
jgi:hypothetical protein